MATKKIKEIQNVIRQGRTNPNNLWCDYKVYQLLEDDSLVFASGGIEDLDQTKLVESFIKRNKKIYTKYVTQEVKEYNEIVKFGKHKGFSVQYIFDNEKSWLKWCLNNYTFKLGEERLKKEITEILK